MGTDWDAYRALFPVTQEWTYLNHAAVSPLCTPVAEAMRRVIDHGYEDGWIGEDHSLEAAEEIRKRVAGLLGATPEEIAFVTNTSEGLNIVANGLAWHEGDNIVGAEREFPSNVYVWLNEAHHGVEMRFAPARDNRILVDDIAALMDERTRLVAVSFVEFGTGFRNNLKAIGDLCQERGALFCVDSIQGLGAFPLDVRECHIDFLANGGHKWLLGITGVGIFYCRRELIPAMQPTSVGWNSVQAADDYYCYNSPLKDNAARWELGCANMVGRYGLGAGIRLLQEIGIGEIAQRILALTNYLIAGLEQRGYRITSPIATTAERSGIICFHHPVHPATELAKRLAEAKIVVSLRGEVIRVSPHFYSNEADIDRLLAALPT